jgi:hypothetical protein
MISKSLYLLMKSTKLFFSLALLILTGMAVCAQNQENKTAGICKIIEYDVSICNAQDPEYMPVESSLEWFRDNLESSTRLAYISLLFESTLSGKLGVTDMENRTLNSDQVRDIFYSQDTIILSRAWPPYDVYDTVVSVLKVNPVFVTALRFREEWTYNAADMSLQKKVLAVAPIMVESAMTENLRPIYTLGKPLCWIHFKEASATKEVITKRIMYGVYYQGPSRQGNLAPDSAAIDLYVNEVIKRLYEGKLIAYTFGDGELADYPLTLLELKNLMKESPTTGSYENLRFIEEWSFDPITLSISKKVVGVCPVVVVYLDEEFYGYRPLFWVYFSDVWMPFGQKFPLIK